MSDLRNAIRAASNAQASDSQDKHDQTPATEPENHKASNTENQQTEVEMVNMTVKVSREQRLHWLIAAKREGSSLTAAITEALNARFGETSKP